MTTTGPVGSDDDRAVGRTAQKQPVGRRGRVLMLVTAIAAGVLALIHAADLVQFVLGLPYTANDIIQGMRADPEQTPDVSRGLPLNLAQTLVTATLTAVVLIGGALSIGRSGALARLGGVVAVLAVALPATTPLLIMPLRVHSARTFSWPAWFDVVLAAIPGSALLAAALACVLLLVASRRPAVPSWRARFPLPAVIAGAVFTLVAIAAQVRLLTMSTPWWTIGMTGVTGMGTGTVVLLSAVLTGALVLGATAGGRLLGAASPLARIGGGLLLAAVLLRVLTQLVHGGMAEPLRIWLTSHPGTMAMFVLQLVPAVGVTALGVLGIVVAALGLFLGGRASADRPA